jgi:hypothetical protein
VRRSSVMLNCEPIESLVFPLLDDDAEQTSGCEVSSASRKYVIRRPPTTKTLLAAPVAEPSVNQDDDAFAAT